MLATGEAHSVREFVELAFSEVGIEVAWKGEGVDEKGINAKTGDVIVAIDPHYFRPTEVDLLIGDPGKAHRQLGWKHETSFTALVKEMMQSDLKVVSGEIRLSDSAYYA